MSGMTSAAVPTGAVECDVNIGDIFLKSDRKYLYQVLEFNRAGGGSDGNLWHMHFRNIITGKASKIDIDKLSSNIEDGKWFTVEHYKPGIPVIWRDSRDQKKYSLE